MIIIPAYEAKKISDSSQDDSLYQLKSNLINNIIANAGRGEKFANEYIASGISLSEIDALTKEFKSAGYSVKITHVVNQKIFSISW
ncbi:hypothetical protein ACG94V_20365 [Acinetobacter sp. ULE_I001]|jgi:hypothetical protein|uniref:hypothetical protein n=1 Tax=unclassified Acinetobacter TaxID=196816 RepID=UPI0030197180